MRLRARKYEFKQSTFNEQRREWLQRASSAGEVINEGLQELYAMGKVDFAMHPRTDKVLTIASDLYPDENDRYSYAAHLVFYDHIGLHRIGQIPPEIALIRTPKKLPPGSSVNAPPIERVGELIVGPGLTDFEVNFRQQSLERRTRTIEVAEFVAERVARDIDALSEVE